MNSFDSRYMTLTPARKLNFVGATIELFEEINKGNLDQTKDSYIGFYNNAIFPLIAIEKSIEEYTIDDCYELVKNIKYVKGYNDSTISSTINHLVFDVCKRWFEKYDPNNDEFEYIDYGRKSEIICNEDLQIRLVKSFSVKQELDLYRILFSKDSDDNGELIGLAIMFLTGMRNNEVCGLNFGDLFEMHDYPNCYYLQITKTTLIDSNRLKLGGKTYNAFRRVPVVDILKEYLLNRKTFIENKISFPFEHRDKHYDSIYEMPIVCRKDNYGARANSKDLTKVGRKILREKLGMTRNEIISIQNEINEDFNEGFENMDKDPTTYLLRRNMATHLYTLGFDMVERQYIMGHKLEETPLVRSNFGDETTIYELLVRLNKHPLNNLDTKVTCCLEDRNLSLNNETNIKLKIHKNSNEMITLDLSNIEVNDELSIVSGGPIERMELYEMELNPLNFDKINILEDMYSEYKKHRKER